MPTPPFQNVHTHIFTGKQVPPWLGRTLVPFPLYYLTNIRVLISLLRLKTHKNSSLRSFYFKIHTLYTDFVFFVRRNTQHFWATKFLLILLKWAITLYVALVMLELLDRFVHDGWIGHGIDYILSISFVRRSMNVHWTVKFLPVFVGIFFVDFAQNLFRLLGKLAWSYITTLIGPNTFSLLKRYYNIALLAHRTTQKDVFKTLRGCYPEGTIFTVLPMDFDYMGAGKLPADANYLAQLDELANLKKEYPDILRPYVFVDPRRIEANPGFLDKMKRLVLEEGFAGIKIYPALGYFPSDKYLLRTFLFAQEQNIPIMTHCIKGIIYYRGMKQKAWNRHPVFTHKRNHKTEDMPLDGYQNSDFSVNFTHPLNYLCLLNPVLLRRVLHRLYDGKTMDTETRLIYAEFGFVWDADEERCTMAKNLKCLKICFAHFGGEDEWEKYLSNERNTTQNSYILKPLYCNPYELEEIPTHWASESWYSIIRSLLMNPDYPNLYTDISFILHDPSIVGLLKSSLCVPRLRDKILYGSDFYVVRQNGSDKLLYTELKGHLDPEDFNRITRDNPHNFYA